MAMQTKVLIDSLASLLNIAARNMRPHGIVFTVWEDGEHDTVVLMSQHPEPGRHLVDFHIREMCAHGQTEIVLAIREHDKAVTRAVSTAVDAFANLNNAWIEEVTSADD